MNSDSTINTITRAASETTRRVTKPARAGLLSALSVAAVAMCAAVPARAQQVAVAIQGYVPSGTDYTGIFGGGTNTNLAGEPFQMNCIIDPSKGLQSTQSVPGASLPYYSQITDGATLGNPVTTCVLTIKGTSFSVGMFDNPPYGSVQSEVWRNVAEKPPQAAFDVYELNSGKGFAQLSLQVSLPNLEVGDYQWNKPVFYSNIGGTGPAIGPATGYFYFDRWPTSTTQQAAGGQLSANVISISPGLYSAADKAGSAAAAAALYGESASAGWLAQFFKPYGTAGKFIAGKIAHNEFIDLTDQAFDAQHLEFSQELINILAAVTGVSNTVIKPDRMDGPELVMLGLAVQQAQMALDPPDWNYKTVQPPSILSLAMTGDPTTDKFMGDYLTVISYSAATLHAHERWEAANIAGDAASVALQLKAFNTYSALAKSAKAVLPADNLALSKLLPVVNVNSFPGGVAGMAASVNALCGQPLPAAANSALLSLGMAQATINQRVCDYAKAVRPSDINPTSLGTLLTTPLP